MKLTRPFSFKYGLLILLISGFLPVIGCNAEVENDITFLNTHWVLIEAEEEKVNFERDIFIQFLEKDNQIKGFAGCNNFFGSFEIEENKLKFGPYGSTRMMCPEADFENKFFELLSNCDSYDLQESTLLLALNGVVILKFEPGTKISI